METDDDLSYYEIITKNKQKEKDKKEEKEHSGEKD
jgi:hypothetical protein